MSALADLRQALTWSARSIELDRGPMMLDTYAQLLDKLGRKVEAIPCEEEAIATQKSRGENTSELEQNLAKLKQ